MELNKEKIGYTFQVSDIESGDGYSVDMREDKMQRGLSQRHIAMISLGGAIGTGLFLGTGSALAACGPAPLLMAYIVVSTFVWIIVQQLGEMISYLPTEGKTTLYALSKRYSSRTLAFVAGWNMWYGQGIVAPTEITACGILVGYWTDANIAIFISIFCFSIIIVNFCPVKFFGELEFWICLIKVICLCGLIILGVVIFFGGGPNQHHVLGFHYWKNPGAFVEHIASGNEGKFLAFWTSVIKSGFSFSFTPEMLGSCASEAKNPRISIPKACNRFVFRLIIFYVLGTLVIGIMVASNDPKLIGEIEKGTSNAAASPFVIGIQNVGIHVLNHIINACILTSAFSCGNGVFYTASRSLYSMALEGDAPKIFAKLNRFGVPYYSVAITGCLCLLSYLNVSNSSSMVFTWLTNIVSISGFISWVFVGITYIRFRKAVVEQNMEHEITFKSLFPVAASYIYIAFFAILSITNGYAAFCGSFSVSDFIAAYVTIPIILVLYVGYRLFRREKNTFIPPTEVDLVTGLDEIKEYAKFNQPEPSKNNFDRFMQWLL